MEFKSHFLLMSRYNERMNKQLFKQVSQLSESQLHKDMGAYFSSVIGTLNHIIVGDLIWLGRFSQFSDRYLSLRSLSSMKAPKGLDEVLYTSIDGWFSAREQVDQAIMSWLETEVLESDFAESLQYYNTKGVASKRNLGELVSHLFNHQTHHRGQISTLLNQLGLDIVLTDFLIDIPDETRA